MRYENHADTFKFFEFLPSQIQRKDCPGCPHNKMLIDSYCYEKCRHNTLNLMNRECVTRDSCERENAKYWNKFKFLPWDGSCKLVKYCDSIKINEKSDIYNFNKIKQCQIVQGSVEIQFSFEYCDNFPDLLVAISILSEIIEIRNNFKVTNSPPTIKNLGFFTNLKAVGGVILDSGVNSLVFDSKTGLGSRLVTPPNNSVSNETFCTYNCDNGTLTIEITPKTYAFVVKILDKVLTNVLDDNVKLTSFVISSDEYYGRQICQFLPALPQ